MARFDHRFQTTLSMEGCDTCMCGGRESDEVHHCYHCEDTGLLPVLDFTDAGIPTSTIMARCGMCDGKSNAEVAEEIRRLGK